MGHSAVLCGPSRIQRIQPAGYPGRRVISRMLGAIQFWSAPRSTHLIFSIKSIRYGTEFTLQPDWQSRAIVPRQDRYPAYSLLLPRERRHTCKSSTDKTIVTTICQSHKIFIDIRAHLGSIIAKVAHHDPFDNNRGHRGDSRETSKPTTEISVA